MKPGLGVQTDVETVEVLPHEWDEGDDDKWQEQEEEWKEGEEWNEEEEEDQWKHGKVDKTWNV